MPRAEQDIDTRVRDALSAILAPGMDGEEIGTVIVRLSRVAFERVRQYVEIVDECCRSCEDEDRADDWFVTSGRVGYVVG